MVIRSVHTNIGLSNVTLEGSLKGGTTVITDLLFFDGGARAP